MGQEEAGRISRAFDRHFDELYSYVAYRVAPDLETAHDIAQEVFLAAVRGLPAGLSERAIGAWLRSVARNKVADHFRTRQKNLTLEEDAGDFNEVLSHGSEQENVPIVSWVMRRLPWRYAEVLEAKYLDGLSVKEIARRKGTSEKAVESSLSRAREAFREAFQKRVEQENCHDHQHSRRP